MVGSGGAAGAMSISASAQESKPNGGWGWRNERALVALCGAASLLGGLLSCVAVLALCVLHAWGCGLTDFKTMNQAT